MTTNSAGSRSRVTPRSADHIAAKPLLVEWLPRRLLTRKNDRKAVEVGDNTAIHGLTERKQACLMRQELADGDSLLAILRELRPVLTMAIAHSRGWLDFDERVSAATCFDSGCIPVAAEEEP